MNTRNGIVTWTLLVAGCTSAGPPAFPHGRPPIDIHRFPTTREFYPAASAAHGESGAPVINACVDAEGRLTAPPMIVRSSGSPRLDAAAIKMATAGSGHYLPDLQNGKPVPRCVEFAIRFDARDYSPRVRGEPAG